MEYQNCLLIINKILISKSNKIYKLKMKQSLTDKWTYYINNHSNNELLKTKI